MNINKYIPDKIKKAYIISVILIVIILIAGIILKKPEFYFAFSIGGLFSLINAYLLFAEVYKLIYNSEKGLKRVYRGFLTRMGVFTLGMLLVAITSKKYYPDKVSSNIIFTGMGFKSFKISIFMTNKFFKV